MQKKKHISFAFVLTTGKIVSTTTGKIEILEEIKCLQKATRKDFLYNGRFHEAIAPVLVMAQCFAIMPVVGIKGDTASDLHFSWKAFRTIYSLIAFVLTTVYASLAIFVAFRNKVEFDLLGLWCILCTCCACMTFGSM